MPQNFKVDQAATFANVILLSSAPKLKFGSDVDQECTKDGTPKFIPSCSLPLTGKNVVDMIVTDLAVFQRADHGSPFKLIELAPGVTADEVAAKTTARYETAG